MVMSDEKVLCLKRETLESAGKFQGLSTKVDRYLALLDNPKNRFFLPRFEAEENFAFKQWIPYVLICKGRKILRYKRSGDGGESRLRGKYSIGIGGHVTERDCAQKAGYLAGLLREVREETGLETAPTSAIAVINDDSTEVGKAHFGVVHIMQIPESAKVESRSGISSPKFISLTETDYQMIHIYESWSQLCLEHLSTILQAQTESKKNAS